MFQMPRGKLGNVDNGFNPRPRVIECRIADADSGAPAPVGRAVGDLDLSFLWRGHWLIVAGVILGLVARSVADLVLVPRYRATAQILIAPTDLRGIEKDVWCRPRRRRTPAYSRSRASPACSPRTRC